MFCKKWVKVCFKIFWGDFLVKKKCEKRNDNICCNKELESNQRFDMGYNISQLFLFPFPATSVPCGEITKKRDVAFGRAYLILAQLDTAVSTLRYVLFRCPSSHDLLVPLFRLHTCVPNTYLPKTYQPIFSSPQELTQIQLFSLRSLVFFLFVRNRQFN